MAHVTATRIVSRRLARELSARAARRVVDLRKTRRQRPEIRAEIAGFGVGVDLPDRADTVEDLPL